MARSIGEIYNRMVEYKESFSILDQLHPDASNSGQAKDTWEKFQQDLLSSSKVSTWRLLFAKVAVVVHSAEILIDEVFARVKQRIGISPVAQTPWYARMALKYRDGYVLVFQDGAKTSDPSYYAFSPQAQDDQSAAIVKRASAVDLTGAVRVKVADLNSNNEPVKLSQQQVDGVQSYFDNIAPAGINVSVISRDPDELRLEMEVIYDPTVIDGNTGELISDPGTKPVDEAAKEYIYDLPFNSTWVLEEMMANIRKAKGVINAYPWRARARPDGAAQWSELFDVTSTGPTKQKNYVALAGHLRLDNIQVTYTKG